MAMLFCDKNSVVHIYFYVYGKNHSMIDRILFNLVFEDISPTKPYVSILQHLARQINCRPYHIFSL